MNRITKSIAIVMALLLWSPMPAFGHPLYSNTWVKGVVTDKRVMAITVDDITDANVRPVVEALLKSHLKATLFIIGSECSSVTVRYASKSGFEIANHGWVHVGIGAQTDAEASESINLTRSLVTSATGLPCRWYRSPYENYGASHGYVGLSRAWATGVWVAGDSISLTEYRRADSRLKYVRYSFNKRFANRKGNIWLAHPCAAFYGNLPWVAKYLAHRKVSTVTLTKLSTLGYPTSHPKTLKKL